VVYLEEVEVRVVLEGFLVHILIEASSVGNDLDLCRLSVLGILNEFLN
jgi:hypothetical protein